MSKSGITLFAIIKFDIRHIHCNNRTSSGGDFYKTSYVSKSFERFDDIVSDAHKHKRS